MARNIRNPNLTRLAAAIAVGVCASLGMVAYSPSATAQVVEARRYDLKAGALDEALTQFGLQSGLQILAPPELVAGHRAPAVSGQQGWREALAKLLAGTGLEWDFVGGNTVVIKKGEAAARSKPVSGGRSQPAEGERVVGMPAIMVKGAKTLNVDIERTADDPQPYVILDRAVIERSAAVNLGDLLRARLPMNAAVTSPFKADEFSGNISNINLRGLGANQTLILIDGRRAARSSAFSPGQADINGIPLDAVERIEVLPSSASAIYGGSATGGVINVILRRDYMGSQIAFTYDNSFDTDSAISRVDLSSGFSLFGGRTSVLLNGSYSEGNMLLVNDRDFVQRGRRLSLANNPSLLPGFRPILGQTANMRSTNGSELVLKDGTALGSSFTSSPIGYAGAASDGGAALVANAGRYNLGISDSANSVSGGGSASLIPSTRVKYFSGSVRHEFSERLQGFMEASRSENDTRAASALDFEWNTLLPSTAPSNPFQQDIYVRVPTQQANGLIHTYSQYDRFGAGLVFQMGQEWAGSADYTWTRSDLSFLYGLPMYRFGGAIVDGTFDVLSDLDGRGVSLRQYQASDYSLSNPRSRVITKNPALRLGGPIGSFKAGRPRLSLLLERQDTEFQAGTIHQLQTNYTTFFTFLPDRTQTVDSAYLELQVPLLSSLSEVDWVDSLELQLAARWDRYENTNAANIWHTQAGYSADPTLRPAFVYVDNKVEEISPLAAIRFQPNGHLAFRGSYSKGFLPPDVNQATSSTQQNNISNTTLVDPRRGNTGLVAPITQYSGGNPHLEAEKSTTWSLGVIFTPEWLEGFRISLDYMDMEKSNNIVTLTQQQIMDNESYLPGRVVRGPNLGTDPAGWAGTVTSVDSSMVNAARAWLTTYDMQLDYTFYSASHGSFTVFGTGTWTTRYDVQLTPTSPVVDYLGWLSGTSASLDFRGNAGVEWSLAPWTVGWNTRYYSGYYVADPALSSSASSLLAQGSGGRVPSQIYHDVFAKYQFGSRTWARSGRVSSSLLDGLELQVGVRNLFNSKPPYEYSDFRFYYSGLGDPRLATYYVTLRQKF